MQATKQLSEQKEKLSECEQRCSDALADGKDVLRLVDIMSASPAGIKAVLEAYLKKLGNYALHCAGRTVYQFISHMHIKIVFAIVPFSISIYFLAFLSD